MACEASWPRGSGSAAELASILGNQRQRRILSILRGRSEPLSIRELATRLAADTTRAGPTDVSEEDVTSIRVDLRHRCLPKLEAVGWIERHPEGISATESFPFGNEEWSLPDLEATDDRVWETISVLLGYPLRQELLQIVADRNHPLTVEELAAELAGHSDAPGTPERSEADSRLLSRLHHFDLPRLAAVGLVAYDPEEKTITRTRSLITLIDRIDLSTGLTEPIATD